MKLMLAIQALECAVMVAVQPPEQAPEKGPPPAAKPEMAGSAVMNFDRDTSGKLPPGWKIGEALGGKAAERPADPANPLSPGKVGVLRALWMVAADPTAPSSPNVLEVVGSTQGIDGYNICICEEHRHKDLDLSAKFRGNTGRATQGGGLAWRIRNADNFFACAYDPSEGKLRAFKVSDGKLREIGAADHRSEGPGISTWYTIQARVRGDSIVCSINGDDLITISEPGSNDEGAIGLWTRGDAATSFDDVTIRNADEPVKKETPRVVDPTIR